MRVSFELRFYIVGGPEAWTGECTVYLSLVLEHDALFIIKINVTVQFVTCEVFIKKTTIHVSNQQLIVLTCS